MQRTRQAIDGAQFLEQRSSLSLQRKCFDGPAKGQPHILGFPGLREIAIHRAIVDGIPEGLHIAIRGDKDPNRIGIEFTHPGEELNPGDPRHALVGKDHRDGVRIQNLHPLFSRRSGEDGKLPSERQFEDAKILGLVVHIEHGKVAMVEQLQRPGSHDRLRRAPERTQAQSRFRPLGDED